MSVFAAPADLPIAAIDSRVGLVGDVHGNEQVASRAARVLHKQGIREVHFLGDFDLLWGAESRNRVLLARFDETLAELDMIAYVTGGNHEDYDVWEAIPVGAGGIRWASERVGMLPRGWRAESAGGVTVASLGGANSIDRYTSRMLGGKWWAQESITNADLSALGAEKVDVLLAHDAPSHPQLLRRLEGGNHRWSDLALEWAQNGREQFQRAVEATRPALTVSGHYHHNFDEIGTYTDLDGQPFDTRSVILNADGRNIFIAVLHVDLVELDFLAY